MPTAHTLSAHINNALKNELKALDETLVLARKAGPLAARVSWWCEATIALSIASDKGAVIDLDPYGNGRYNGFERSYRTAQNSARAAGWASTKARSAAELRSHGKFAPDIIDPEMAMELHYSVLSNVLDDERLGRYRTRDVAIIDPRINKIVSHGERPENIAPAMTAWANDHSLANMGHVHPVVRSALAHLEFVRIHPCPDGNGRTGRVIIAPMHAEQGVPDLPFPLVFERSRDQYVATICDALKENDQEKYVRWHVSAMQDAAETAVRFGPRLQDLSDRMATAIMSSPAKMLNEDEAKLVASAIVGQPLITASDISEQANITERKAREALFNLEQARGLLTRRSALGDVSFHVCYDVKSEILQEYLQDGISKKAPLAQAAAASNAQDIVTERQAPVLKLVHSKSAGPVR